MATTGNHQRKPGKRGKVTGWSPGAARRNVAFLRSVDERELTGKGWAYTLTLRDCPATSEHWAKIQRAWIERQSRAGMIRLHWVMEFQSRGVPHLHVAAWYEGENKGGHAAVCDWLDITGELGTSDRGQDYREIKGVVGWFQYMAKHCGRGSKHYQRQQSSMPKRWEKCPRVWGKRGTWVTVEPMQGELTDRQYFRFRRLVRSWRTSKARADVPGPGWSWQVSTLLSRPICRDMKIPAGLIGTAKTTLRQRLRHLAHVRAMLRCPDPKLSAVRGVNEWIPTEVQAELLRAV